MSNSLRSSSSSASSRFLKAAVSLAVDYFAVEEPKPALGNLAGFSTPLTVLLTFFFFLSLYFSVVLAVVPTEVRRDGVIEAGFVTCSN